MRTNIYLSLFLSLIIGLYSCNPVNDKKQKDDATIEQKQIDEQTPAIAEEFEEINVSDFNIKLSQNTAELSPEDIMKLYYPLKVETDEGNEKIIISKRTLNNGNIEVKLIHDNLLDDSVKGIKIIMELSKSNNRWFVVSLKNNWKCWRGHSNWGIEDCL